MRLNLSLLLAVTALAPLGLARPGPAQVADIEIDIEVIHEDKQLPANAKAERQPQKTKFMRLTRGHENEPVALQTAIVRYQAKEGGADGRPGRRGAHRRQGLLPASERRV